MAVSGDATTGQATLAPTRKVAGGGVSGAASAILILIYNTYVSPNAPLPAELAAALTVIITFLVSYLVPPASTEAVVPSVPDAAATSTR